MSTNKNKIGIIWRTVPPSSGVITGGLPWCIALSIKLATVLKVALVCTYTHLYTLTHRIVPGTWYFPPSAQLWVAPFNLPRVFPWYFPWYSPLYSAQADMNMWPNMNKIVTVEASLILKTHTEWYSDLGTRLYSGSLNTVIQYWSCLIIAIIFIFVFSCTDHRLHHHLAAVPLGDHPHHLLHPVAERTVGIWRGRERGGGGRERGREGERGEREGERGEREEREEG